jgi:dolichyl-phosphate beta-glucosyltransferase
MLEPAFEFLEDWSKEQNITYEIIVVDDKSTDATTTVVRDYMLKYGDKHNMKLLELSRNFGKGGAVKQGVKRASGKFILMVRHNVWSMLSCADICALRVQVDADGATDINDLRKLYNDLQITMKPSSRLNNANVGVAVGSRAHMRNLHSAQRRSVGRIILTQGFHFLVALLCTRNVRDTQCGFKLFTRQSARVLFSNLHLESWAFDTEIIYLAETMKFPIVEVSFCGWDKYSC